MYKIEAENVEVYFICYKKQEMELVETYYDPILNIHNWYFNAYLAYKYWRHNFKKLKMGELARKLLIIAASKYIIYALENELYHNNKEYQRLLKDSKIIDYELQEIIHETSFLDD
ncbi:MAG: hypothetical protein NC483_07890 [Ruminococcus sp.]|nr:hypothetical protein [Ruminococcus sp.]